MLNVLPHVFIHQATLTVFTTYLHCITPVEPNLLVLVYNLLLLQSRASLTQSGGTMNTKETTAAPSYPSNV